VAAAPADALAGSGDLVYPVYKVSFHSTELHFPSTALSHSVGFAGVDFFLVQFSAA
jgi:hypothetical protein